jgi:hypothetical protein
MQDNQDKDENESIPTLDQTNLSFLNESSIEGVYGNLQLTVLSKTPDPKSHSSLNVFTPCTTRVLEEVSPGETGKLDSAGVVTGLENISNNEDSLSPILPQSPSPSSSNPPSSNHRKSPSETPLKSQSQNGGEAIIEDRVIPFCLYGDGLTKNEKPADSVNNLQVEHSDNQVKEDEGMAQKVKNITSSFTIILVILAIAIIGALALAAFYYSASIGNFLKPYINGIRTKLDHIHIPPLLIPTTYLHLANSTPKMPYHSLSDPNIPTTYVVADTYHSITSR